MSVFKRWNGAQWETIGPGVTSARFNNINNMIAPEFDPKNTYNVGDYVVQSDKLYRCINRIGTPQAWIIENWQEVKLGPDVTDLRNNVVTVSDIQPTSENNRIWVKPDNNNMKIPLVEDVMMLPNPNDYGENDQIPRSTGTGIEWVDYGLPSDQQVEDAINAWLDVHPEATTTVQDDSLTTPKYKNGSITEEKLDNDLYLKVLKEYVTPEIFGAVGDGITDDTLALQNALDYCASTEKTLYCFNKYLITNTITCLCNFIVNGTIIYDGDNEAIIVGSSNVFVDHRIKISVTKKVQSLSTTSVGVRFINIYASYIELSLVNGFYHGVEFIGDSHGVTYNIIQLYDICDCYRGIILTNKNPGGYCNENLFLKGRIWTSSSSPYATNNICITITSERGYQNNNNTFIATCVEGAAIGFDMQYAVENYATYIRTEGTQKVAIFTNNCTRNMILIGNGNESYNDESDGVNIVSNTIDLFANTLFNKIFEIGDSIIESVNLGTDCFNEKSYGIQKINNLPALTYNMRDTQYIPNKNGFELNRLGWVGHMFKIITTTNISEQIGVMITGTGRCRIGIIMFDNDDNVIETSPISLTRGLFFSKYAPSASGRPFIIHTHGSDLQLLNGGSQLVLLKLPDTVKKFYIYVNSNYNFIVNNLQIFSRSNNIISIPAKLNHCCCTATPESIGYDGQFVLNTSPSAENIGWRYFSNQWNPVSN